MGFFDFIGDITSGGAISAAKDANRQAAQQADIARQLADPSRLDQILFGSPARPADPGALGNKGLFGQSFGFANTFLNDLTGARAASPATPGLVSQFRQGNMPQLNQTLDDILRSGQFLQSGTASQLGRRGLTGTGLGEALTGAFAAAPVQAATTARRGFDQSNFTQALNAAIQLMSAQAGVGVAPTQGVPSGAGVTGNAALSFLLPFLGAGGFGGGNNFGGGGQGAFGGQNLGGSALGF